MQVTFICLNQVAGKHFYTLLPPVNINRMNFYLKTTSKTVKSGVVDRL